MIKANRAIVRNRNFINVGYRSSLTMGADCYMGRPCALSLSFSQCSHRSLSLHSR